MKTVMLVLAIVLLIGLAMYFMAVNRQLDDCANVGGHWVTEGNQTICDVK